MSEGDSGLHLSGWRQPDGLSTPVLGSARGLPGSLAKVSSQEPETPGHAPHRSPPEDGAAGWGRGGGFPLWGAPAPRGDLGPQPLPSAHRPCCSSRLFIYNLHSASFQESSEALAEKLLPQAGLCSHQPWAPSPWTLSPWLASSDVSAWRPGRTGSGPRDRPSLPGAAHCLLLLWGPRRFLQNALLSPGGRGPGDGCTPLLPLGYLSWGHSYPVRAGAPPAPPLDLAQPWKGPECCGGMRGGSWVSTGIQAGSPAPVSGGRHAGREGPAGRELREGQRLQTRAGVALMIWSEPWVKKSATLLTSTAGTQVAAVPPQPHWGLRASCLGQRGRP